MKRLLAYALLPAALAAVAGCGGTACTSNAATPQNKGGLPTCTLAAGTTATIDIALCGKCTDSAPSCQAEFVNGQLQVGPTVQQCQEQAGCPIAAGCAFTPPHATCTVAVPVGATSGQMVVSADQTYTTQLVIGSSTNCQL